MKAWGYIRFSCEKQGENSVERQRDSIQRWAVRMGVHVVGWSQDLEISRTTDHSDRPGLLEAVSAINSGEASILVAETVSRFAGDPGILHAIKKAIGKRGRLAVANDSGDADMDEDRQDFEAIFSRYEIRQIRSRTKGALAMKRMRGERCGQIPYGKRLKADGQHTLRDGQKTCVPSCAGCLHLEDNPDELRLLARIKLLKQTAGIREVARILEREGFRGRSGRPLDHSQVHRLLDRNNSVC